MYIVVCFLLGNSPVSEFYMPMFRNTLSVPSSQAGRCRMTKFENSWGIHTGEGLARKQPEPIRRRVTGYGWVRLQSRYCKGNNPHGGCGSPRGLLPFHYRPCNRTHPYPVTFLPIRSGYFRAKPSPVWIPQLFSNLVILHLPAY